MTWTVPGTDSLFRYGGRGRNRPFPGHGSVSCPPTARYTADMRTMAIASLAVLVSTALLAQSPAPPRPPPAAALSVQAQIFKGDLGEMKKRRVIRAGVAYNRTHYFIDQGVQRGMAYDALKAFEDDLNAGIKSQLDKVNVVFFPMSRDEMAAALLEGRVDLLAANLTITPERRKIADFSDPVRSDVREIVVSGPGAAPIATKADLGGKTVLVRTGSIYHDHLVSLNGRLKAQGLPEVQIQLAPIYLEDDDVLEMVNAGLAQYTVVDNFLAEFWQQIFTGLKLHPNIALTLDGEIAVAMRPEQPRAQGRRSTPSSRSTAAARCSATC